MWKIRHVFDGDYGCEELAPGAKPMVSVTLINEAEWVADRLVNIAEGGNERNS